MNSKKYDFVNVSVVVNSLRFFFYYYVRVTLISRFFFVSRNSRNWHVAKISCYKVTRTFRLANRVDIDKTCNQAVFIRRKGKKERLIHLLRLFKTIAGYNADFTTSYALRNESI